jgi:hypothetical protein
MEVHFSPELEKQLHELAAQSGRAADEVVQDALRGYFDEVHHTRKMLDSRHDELTSGAVKPISGDEVERYFRDKSTAARSRQSNS